MAEFLQQGSGDATPQTLQQGASPPTYTELVERVENLEKQKIERGQLPMADIMKWLESNWEVPVQAQEGRWAVRRAWGTGVVGGSNIMLCQSGSLEVPRTGVYITMLSATGYVAAPGGPYAIALYPYNGAAWTMSGPSSLFYNAAGIHMSLLTALDVTRMPAGLYTDLRTWTPLGGVVHDNNDWWNYLMIGPVSD